MFQKNSHKQVILDSKEFFPCPKLYVLMRNDCIVVEKKKREEEEKKVERARIEATAATPSQPDRLEVSRSDVPLHCFFLFLFF